MTSHHIGAIVLDYKQTCHFALQEAERAWESARVTEKRARKLRDLLRLVVCIERYNEIHDSRAKTATADAAARNAT